MANRRRKKWKQWQIFSSWAPKSLWTVPAAMKLEDACFLEGKLWQTQAAYYKAQTSFYRQKSIQSYGFSSSHVWLWELDHKESWALKNWCFWTVVLEKTLESPLGWKMIKPVNPKGNTLNTHWKDWCWSWSSNTSATWCRESTHWKRLWCWERLQAGGKGTTKDGMVGWYHLTQRTWVWVNSRR